MSQPRSETDELLYDPATFPAEPTPEEFEMFKQQVSEWVKLDESIKKLSVAVRERRVHQRAISSKISEFMKKYKYDDLNTQQGVIRASVRQVKQPLRVNDIRQQLLDIGEDTRITPAEIIDRIFNAERPVCTKESLRRVVPKVSLRLDI